MQVITETELLERIDAFLERHDMAPTTFGRKATGEPQLIDSIRNKGRSPSLKVTNKVIAFMDEQDRAQRAAALPPPPLELTAQEDEGAELPFGKAPVNPTGASSPTCSTTAGRPPLSAANGSSRFSTADQSAQGTRRKPSCSAADGGRIRSAGES